VEIDKCYILPVVLPLVKVVYLSIETKIKKIISCKNKDFLSKSKTPNNIILNDTVFSSNYLPDNVFYRDIEIENITEHFIPTQYGKYCPDLSIYGVTGSGKTLITKIIFRTLAKEAKDTYYIFISCNEYKTPTSILKFILSQINTNEKGLSESDILQLIKKNIENKLMVLIFDEIDVFLKKDKSYENLLLTFSDWNNCVLIFISNDPGWHEYIKDHRTVSRLHLSNMIFEPYYSDEIFHIIKDRAAIGLKPGVISDDLLCKIAEFSAQYSGDARVAIKILSKAAKYAERFEHKEIDQGLIERVVNSLEEDNKIDFITSLPPQHKLILVAIYLASTDFKNPYFDVIYHEYEKLINNKEVWKKLKRDTIRKYLEELETYRLIQKETGKGRGRGKGRESTKIKLNFDKEKFKEKVIIKMLKQDHHTAKTPPLSSY